jgi:hypothetical protein
VLWIRIGFNANPDPGSKKLNFCMINKLKVDPGGSLSGSRCTKLVPTLCSSLTFGVSVWYFINDKEESPLITTRLCNVNLLQEMDPKKKGKKYKTSPSPAVSVEVPV